MAEKPAKGVRGYLLYNFHSGKHFFRIYDHENHTHTDYRLAAEDIEVEIVAGGISLYEEDGNNRLDWSSEYLKRARPDAT